MDVSRVRQRQLQRQSISISNATLLMIGITTVALGVVLAWFTGEGRIAQIFAQLNQLQQTPPLWLEVPMVTGHYLLLPTVVLFLMAYGITRLSPQPRHWSRLVVISILLVLVIRYVLWRSLSTLNLDTPANGIASLLLFTMEMLGLGTSIIQLCLLLRVRDRQQQANHMQVAVTEGEFIPSVDVFIPTYDEPAFILRRTVMGCQAMRYPRKTVYLLDDTRRPEIQALAAELGCNYLTRSDNQHAKAGNLNHAIAQTQGDLIASFDADFVPTRNFLERTVGFFQDATIGLVQTPQSFYNP
ncbi:MAG: glycosyltransferase, partial [Cyanobacteria bacterium J06632_22]